MARLLWKLILNVDTCLAFGCSCELLPLIGGTYESLTVVQVEIAGSVFAFASP